MTDRESALIISTPRWWTVFGCLIAAISALPIVLVIKLAGLSSTSPRLVDVAVAVLVSLLLTALMILLHEVFHKIGFVAGGLGWRDSTIIRKGWRFCVRTECRVSRKAEAWSLGAVFVLAAAWTLATAVLLWVTRSVLWLPALPEVVAALAAGSWLAGWSDLYWLLCILRHPGATEYEDRGDELWTYLPEGV